MTENRKIIWITGASSGIGKHLALEYAVEKPVLILSSRNIKALEEVKQACEQKGAEAHIVPLDLESPESVSEASENVLARFPRIDILINNGGVSQRSLFIETPLEIDRKIMEINFFGTAHLTKKIIPRMIEQKGGHLVVISSLTGKFGFPLRSAYAASKHALLGYFETIYAELKQYNIRVTMVCPGRIKTNVSLNALDKTGNSYGKMDKGQDKGMSPERCARKIMKAIRKNKLEVYVGSFDILMVYLKRYFPFIFRILLTKVSPV